MQRASASVQLVCTWVFRLAAANLLWWLVTLAGGVVLGIFPATAALAALVTGWFAGDIRDADSPRAVRSFFRAARAYTGRALLLGYLALAVGALLAADLWVVRSQHGVGATVVAALSGLGASLWVVTVVHLPFVLVRRPDAPVREQLRAALWTGLLSPLNSLGVVVAYVMLSLALGRYPGLALFFSTSPLLALTAWLERRHTRSRTGTDHDDRSATVGPVTVTDEPSRA